MKTVLFLAFALFGFTAAVEFDRVCRDLPVVQDFNLRAYAGNWYELKRYETTLQTNGDCSTFDYSYDFAIEEPSSLDVNVRWSYTDGSSVNYYGYATAADRTVGRLTVDWEHKDINQDYHILATDYENYSVIWDCQNLDGGRSNEDAWVLSKAQTLSEEHQAEVRAIVGQFLDESIMRDTYQGENCLIIEG